MKSICKSVFISLILLISVHTIHAENSFDAVTVQESLAVSSIHEKIAEADAEVSIVLPDYPGLDPIIFYNHLSLPYTKSSRSISIDGTSMPLFLSEIKDIPKALRPLTVGLRIKNKNLGAVWNEDREIEVLDVDIEVLIYKKRRWEINQSTKPSLKFVLKETALFVESIERDKNTIWISFSEPIPKTDNDLFNEFLSGKLVDGLITLEISDY